MLKYLAHGEKPEATIMINKGSTISPDLSVEETIVILHIYPEVHLGRFI